MAKEEKTLPQKKEKAKKSGGNKFLRTITAIPKRMWNAIGNTIAELKKVTWPTRKDLINYTTIVLAFMVLMAVVVGLLDLGASELISLMIRR
jgi:preprotein translocase, SecE subunit, bacterial